MVNARSEFEILGVPRASWLRCWSLLPDATRSSAVAELIEGAEVIDIRHPRAGLALMKMQDSALGDQFYIGEIPWSRSQVQVRVTDGRIGEGAAEWMDDRVSVVRELAILDAVLAHRLAGWELAQELLLAGQDIARKIDRNRSVLLSSTRVDFKRLEDNHA